MPESEFEEYVDCRSALLSAITVARDRAERGMANEGKRKKYETDIFRLENEIGDMTECANHMKDIYKNIQDYNNRHQENVKNILDLAIEEAGNLVPNAVTRGIHLQHGKDNRVYIVNERGQDVNLREGSAYRAILGVTIRYAALKAKPDALQIMLLDEYFFTLSDATADAMKDVLDAMKRDMTIICIEQRRNVVAGIVDAEYTFRKGANELTRVTKTL